MMRKNIIFSCCLSLLFLPLILSSGHGGGSWIYLDFRPLAITVSIVFIVINFITSSILLYKLKQLNFFLVQVTSFVCTALLLVLCFVALVKIGSAGSSERFDAGELLERRKPLANVVRLESWWYVPNEAHPESIHVKVFAQNEGRFTGSVYGGPGCKPPYTFGEGEVQQRQVYAGETFIYEIPLSFVDSTQTSFSAPACDVAITLYLFSHDAGSVADDDVIKVWSTIPPTEKDDGERFFAPLPPRSLFPQDSLL